MKTIRSVTQGVLITGSLVLAIGLLTGTAEAVTVEVKCGKKTKAAIAGALTQAVPGEPLILVIKGKCTENVTVTTTIDDLTLRGDPKGGKVVARDPTQDTIRIEGATRVVIDNLIITGGRTCVVAQNGAFVTLRNSTIENCTRDGLAIRRGSTGVTEGSTIRQSERFGVFVGDTSSARFNGTRIESDVVDAPLSSTDPFRGGALGVFHASSVRVLGGNEIVNTAGGRAVQIFHLADFRQEFGPDTISGNPAIAFGNISVAELRGAVVVTGPLQASRHSVLTLAKRFAGDAIIDGDITVNSDSAVVFGGSFTPTDTGIALGVFRVNGTLTCFDSESSAVGPFELIFADPPTQVNCTGFNQEEVLPPPPP